MHPSPVSRSSVHSKGVFWLSKCLNGSIISVLQKQCTTWFTSPSHALTSEMFGGGEVVDGGCVLCCGLDTILSNHEPGKLNLLPGKSELLGIEYESILVAIGQDATDPLKSPPSDE